MRGGIIGSFMSFPGFLHRMKAVTGETGRNATEIKRRFKEETLQRSSIFIIESYFRIYRISKCVLRSRLAYYYISCNAFQTGVTRIITISFIIYHFELITFL